MPVIQFKGKTAIESYHHTIPHHTLEFDVKLSVLSKGEKPSVATVILSSKATIYASSLIKYAIR